MSEPKVSRFGAKISYWLFTSFLIIVAGATGSWFLGADMVRDRVSAMARTSVGSGGSFTASAITVTGFPFTFDAKITGIRVTGRTPRGLWEWQAEQVKARISPWRKSTVSFDLAGGHKLRFRVGRRPLDLHITAAAAPGEFTAAAADAPRIVKVNASKLVIRDATTGQRIDAESASIQIFTTAQAKTSSSESSAGLLVEFKGVTLPKAADKLLGRKLERFAAEIQVLGDLPLPLERPRLKRWHINGGVLDIKNLDLVWGPAKLSGNGTMGLDEALQPEASLTARITGHRKTVDALVAAGIVQKRVARGVKLVLDMMSRQTKPGAEAVIRLPLSIQNRVIYIGLARLARLPQIRW
jgi:hypothetical protein